MRNYLPPVEHLDFPLVFSLLMGIEGKEQEKYDMTLCVLSEGDHDHL